MLKHFKTLFIISLATPLVAVDFSQLSPSQQGTVEGGCMAVTDKAIVMADQKGTLDFKTYSQTKSSLFNTCVSLAKLEGTKVVFPETYVVYEIVIGKK